MMYEPCVVTETICAKGYSMEKNRRQFLEFMGLGTIGVSAVISSPKVSQTVLAGPKRDLTFNPIEPSSADKFVLADHFNYYPIASWKDPLNDKGDRFGFNNDYIGILPFKGKDDEAIMFVNHEFPHPLMVAGFDGKGEKSKEQVLEEQKALGLTIMKIKRSSEGKWTLVKNDPINRRIDGTTAIPFANSVEVAGSKTAIGTFANCSGGITPWGSVLSCEENYQDYYGDVTHDSEGKVSWNKESKFGWINHFNRRPEHYGWIVEADPLSGAAKKLTSLGRFAHEGATVTTTKDGRIVVYSGDDAKAQCFYKFISDSSTSLEKGTLYVANIGLGRWIPLDIEKTPILKKHFKTQLDVLIHTRKAAKIVGGSPLDRPEGCAINPLTKGVFLSLTNNTSRGNYFGYIAKFEEDNADHGSLTFKYGAYVAGGPKTGLACPDNIAFDRRGNL